LGGGANLIAQPDRTNRPADMSAAHAERLARAEERTGNVLNGKYRLDRVLGVGGMAAVFAATHLRNASRVAVKILHREMAVDESVRLRFLREGYAANSVEHPGTVRILDDDTAEDGSVFLVMELLEGETLDARWERSGHRLNAREVARLIYQLLDVLAAAHAKGIVHRDIKPENLFLTRDGAVKVLDFGVARLAEAPVTTTQRGGIVGTPAFMSPEQVLGKSVDAQSDIWSAGATAFTLLAKRFVHDAATAQEMMVIVGSRPPRSLALTAPDVPPPLARVVDYALKFNKEERWLDARTMQAALAHAFQKAFAAPMPGTEDVEVREISEPTSDNMPALAERTFDRSSAVTVLAGEMQIVSRPLDIPPPDVNTTARRRASGWRAWSGWPRSVLFAAGGTLIVAAASLVAAMTAGTSSPVAAGAGMGALPRAAPPSPFAPQRASVQSPSKAAQSRPPAPPSFAVESLPTAEEIAKPAPNPTHANADEPIATHTPEPAPAKSAQPHGRAGCSPPFILDPVTGKKKWKLECL
ncbi:MAG: protein kinase domain-containing protein, partial [Polyangiaceae bacterium]